jgi:hypothetical protein
VARSFALPRPPAALSAALLRWLPFVAIGVGAVLLIVAEFLVLREVKAVTAVPRGGTVTGGSYHHYALGVIGLALLVMGFGAGFRGARPAAVACLVLSLAAVVVVLFVDRPEINDAGILADTYDLAQAHPTAGFYVESLGAALALVGSVAALVLRPAEPPRRPARRTSTAAG